MKKIQFIFLAILSFNYIFSAYALNEYYPLERIGSSARPFGMGNAYSAITDDVSSILYNTAGLGGMHKNQVIFMHSNRFGFDTKLNYLAFAKPVNNHGTWAFSWMYESIDQIPVTARIGDRTVIDHYIGDDEHIYSLAYGHKFSPRFSSGLRLKYHFMDQTGYKGKGFGFDLGIKYRATKYFGLGFNLMDITSTDITWDSGHIDTIPLMLKMGIASYLLDENLILTADADFVQDRSVDWHIGTEYWFSKLFAIRIGAERSQFTAGISFKKDSWSFDYGYQNHEFEDLHRLSITFDLGHLESDINNSRKLSKNETTEAQMKKYQDIEAKRRKQEVLKIINRSNSFDIDDLDELERLKKEASEDVKKILKGEFNDEERLKNLASEAVAKGSLEFRDKDGIYMIEDISKESNVSKEDETKIRVSAEEKTFIPHPNLSKLEPGNKVTITENIDLESSIKVNKPINDLETKARFAIHRLSDTIKEYNRLQPQNAKSLQDLVSAHYLEFIPHDPWGQYYRIDNDFGVVLSAGKDLIYGTEDDIVKSFVR